MNSAWTRNLPTEEEKAEFLQRLHSSKRVLDRLKEIMGEEEQRIAASETSAEAYEIPSWAFLQAHKNGFRHCIRILNKLLTLDPKEK